MSKKKETQRNWKFIVCGFLRFTWNLWFALSSGKCLNKQGINTKFLWLWLAYPRQWDYTLILHEKKHQFQTKMLYYITLDQGFLESANMFYARKWTNFSYQYKLFITEINEIFSSFWVPKTIVPIIKFCSHLLLYVCK